MPCPPPACTLPISQPPYIPEMKKSSAAAANSVPLQSSSISSPQFTYGTSVTTCPVTRRFSSLSPSFTPFYPQSKQKHAFSTSDSKTCTASYEGYDLKQSMDGNYSYYHPYTTHSVDVSSFSNYTDYSGLASDYEFPWTSHDYYGGQSYDQWGSHGGWQEFSPTSDYLDSSHWGEPSPVEYLYANVCTGELRSPSYFPPDLVSYPPESALSEEEAGTFPRNTVVLPQPESCASSSAILSSHSQGVFAPSSAALSAKSMEEHGFSRCPQNKKWKMDASNVMMENSEASSQERLPMLIDSCGMGFSDGHEKESTANRIAFSELKGRSSGSEELCTIQDSVSLEGQDPQIQLSLGSPRTVREPHENRKNQKILRGLTCTVPKSVPEQFTANLLEEDQLHSKQDQLIQNSSNLSFEQGSQGKGQRKIIVGQNPTVCVSSVLPRSVGRDSTLVSTEMSPQHLKPISPRTVQDQTETRHCISVNSGHSCPGGCAGGLASCTVSEHMNAQVSGLSSDETSKFEQKVHSPSVNGAKIPFPMPFRQYVGEEAIADNDQEAESCKDSDCVLDLSCAEKTCSKHGSLSNFMPSSSGYQFLISSIYNLSSVLATKQLGEDIDGFGYMDPHALEQTICNLSYCLLKQLSNNLVQRSKKLSMNCKLIRNSSILTLGQRLRGEDLWKDALPQKSTVSSFNTEYSTDGRLGSKQKVSQSFESFTDCLHTLSNVKNGFFYQKVSADDVQNDQSNNESKCYSESFQDRVYLDDGLVSKLAPSSNCGQLLITSMCNVSRVLLTSQSAECSNGSEHVDLDALNKTLYYLSHCLLNRSTDNLGSPKPIMDIQSIEKSSVVNTEQELHGKGVGKDASYHSSFVSGDTKLQPSTESTSGSKVMAPECLEHVSTEIAKGARGKTNPPIKNSGCFARECLCAPGNITGVIGCTSGSTDYAEQSVPGASVSSLVATSKSGEKNSCKSSKDEAKISLAAEMQESCNDGVIVNDVWNAWSNEVSKCDLTSAYPDRNSLNNVLCVKAMPSSNGCQLLIACMHNLAKVLFTCQKLEHPNGFSHVELAAVEHSISMLSDCLLRQSSDMLIRQEELHRQKIVGQADLHTGSEELACLQESSISDMMFMEPSLHMKYQRMFLPPETELPALPNGRDSLGKGSKINQKLTSLKRCVEEAASSSVIKHMEKPLKKVFELQDKLVKLQDNIAYERNESNTVLSTITNLWREAHEAICHSKSEITEIKTELEGLKQLLMNLENPGSNQSESKGFNSRSLERDMHGLNQEDRSGRTLDFISHSSQNSKEEQKQSEKNLESEGNTDCFESWGRGLPKSEEVMTGYFEPVRSSEMESAASFPDTKEVISRFSLLQARGACSNNVNEDKTTWNFPTGVDDGVAQRLSLLLARQSVDLNLRCLENTSTNGLCSVFGESLALTSNPLNAREGMPHHKTVNFVSQLPASLNSEVLNAVSVEHHGFGKEEFHCLDRNPVSEEIQDDTSRKCYGCLDGWMQVEGRGNKASEIKSNNFIDHKPNSRNQLKGLEEFLQDRELKINWNTYQQEETEIICLKPNSSERHITCLEGDADWEHVLMSAT